MSLDFRKLIGDGKCARCRGPIGQIFHRYRIDLGAINASRVQQLGGLQTFLGGSSALMAAMSPYRADDIVKFTTDVDPNAGTTLCVCNDCHVESLCVAELVETTNERNKERS